MKKLLTLFMLTVLLTLNVKGQILYNRYTSFNPYYGKSQTYTNPIDNDNIDRKFELGIIVMGVGLITILASTYNYSYYSFPKQVNLPVLYTGIGLTTTGLIISLSNNNRKKRKNKDNDSNVFYENK